MPTKHETDIGLIGQLFGQERLVIDRHIPGRTCFHSHFGACRRLVNGPWIAHRDWIEALSMRPLRANLQSALVHAAVHHHGQKFSVGRLQLLSSASGTPFGGSLLKMQRQNSSLRCVYGYALGRGAQAMICDWLVLDLESRWAHSMVFPHDSKPLRPRSMDTLIALGARVLCLINTVVEARQLADSLPNHLALAGHPRFSPYLDNHQSLAKTQIVIWPIDALRSQVLQKLHFDALFLMNPTTAEQQQGERWAESQRVTEVVTITNPDHMDSDSFLRFWSSCGKPSILLRGETPLLKPVEAWVRNQGIQVHSHNNGAQLGLFR